MENKKLMNVKTLGKTNIAKIKRHFKKSNNLPINTKLRDLMAFAYVDNLEELHFYMKNEYNEYVSSFNVKIDEYRKTLPIRRSQYNPIKMMHKKQTYDFFNANFKKIDSFLGEQKNKFLINSYNYKILNILPSQTVWLNNISQGILLHFTKKNLKTRNVDGYNDVEKKITNLNNDFINNAIRKIYDSLISN